MPKPSFYESKIMALKTIDKMVENEISEDNIIYHIETSYGFSSKMVKNRLELLKNIVKNKENGRNL